MTAAQDLTPEEIIEFWFPDGPEPEFDAHMAHWIWRMRGGANDEILAKFVEATELAAAGQYDNWAKTTHGRLALIILLDQFPRTVWAGSPAAYAQDPKALVLCLEGLDNGHFDALENVWYKSVFKLPMEHCECPEHLANLDRVIEIADKLIDEAPENLRECYVMGAGQPRKHRAVIAQFGRHSHRNDVLGRTSTPEELEYIAAGIFPHEVDLEDTMAQARKT